MDGSELFLKIFPRDIREILKASPAEAAGLQELRLRAGAPLMAVYRNREYFVGWEGELLSEREGAFSVTPGHVRETVDLAANHSLYAYEDEIRQGFLTIQGGHRVGIAGRCVAENGSVRTQKFISFINVRLAHEIRGCAVPLLPYLYGNGALKHTLLISPPRCGKTTLLRDLVRLISDGNAFGAGMNVGVVDERSEIAACYQGVPQNDLGIRTVVLDCCPKAVGMLMMIRTMSPAAVAVDEIGGREDLAAIEYVLNCGCRLLATVHGDSLEDVRRKPVLKELLGEQAFERFVILDGRAQAGRIREIVSGDGEILYRAEEEQ